MKAQDAAGNSQSGVPIAFPITSAPSGVSGQSLSVANTTTLADGTASTVLTLGNKVGSYQVTATCSQCTPNSITFNATVRQPLLLISTGDAQVGNVNQPLPVPLTALVQDQNRAAQGNVAVNFAISIPTSPVGQALQSVDPQTGVDGKARATLTLGNIAADYAVTCACPSCVPAASSVTFHACGKLPNDNFQQGDARWGSLFYDNACQVIGSTVQVHCGVNKPPPGTTPVTIAGAGCGISALADAINFYHTTLNSSIPQTDPGTLNIFLESSIIDGYKEAGKIRWPKIFDFTNGIIHYVSFGGGDIGGANTQQSLLQTVDTDILAGRPVIFRVRHVLSSGTVSSHFVTAAGKCGDKYIISDPAGTRTLYDPNDPGF